MTDDELDEARLLWAELLLDSLRRGPRLLAEWGYCSVCQLTALGAFRWCGQLWAYCAPCATRWPILDDLGGLLDLDPLDDRRAEEHAPLLASFQELDPLPPEISPREIPISDTSMEETMRRESTTTPKSFGIDPHAYLRPRETGPLTGLRAPDRIAVTDAILRDIIEHPLVERHPLSGVLLLNPGKIWERVRDVVVDRERDLNFEQLLRSGDPPPGPTFAIRGVVEILYRLRARRAELEQQLHALDTIEGAFSEQQPA